MSTSTEEADAAMSPAPAKSPTSLLDLPDELLARIFEFTTRDKRLWLPRPKGASRQDIDMLNPVRLNRRIRRICRPSVLRVTIPHDDDGVRLARILADRESRCSVVDLAIALYGTARLPFVSLAGFTNIRTLEIVFNTLSPEILMGLSSLSHLVSLELLGGNLSYRDADAEEPLDLRLAGSVRRLVVSRWEWSVYAEGNPRDAVIGLGQLETLDVKVNERFALDDTLPWRTLRELAVRSEPSLQAGVEDFLDGLDAACTANTPSRLPLRRLTLDFPLAKRPQDGFSHVELVKVLSSLAQTDVEELALQRLPLILADEEALSLPSVEWLALHELEYTVEGDEWQRTALGDLPTILSFFPNLRRLDVEKAEDSNPWPYQAVDNLECARDFPTFFALLYLLACQTEVTEIRIHEDRYSREVRWTREPEETEWSCEQYELETW
ncbi:hypothetical protein NBRC10512_007584 [Rhodotorula toruloides]|uniref:RHTO0S09e07954g1_1 n=2 Tax=Rhodotorula toruloides TaxID=5286 RepID=A0A061B456_RHOTO|nr:uncharacterized protein RHTO_03899 [Rhodotorula toruloides NP11]EMS19856.1 hypothetical protein RHTO_03899 [Rhodotorula toruloides NP11]KAJ8292894.1 hypothetical protein OF846_004151 [Rhodotorula toruloides]CDR44719.1 RHTO0S09e07954g1_1 [Rhodotorula toruloides]